MIGKICISVTPFYDARKKQNAFKKRPILIISGPRNNDYTVLPVSTVSKKENLDKEYDIEIKPEDYPELHLDRVCYIRTHKQTNIHKNSITQTIGDMKTFYEELYVEVLSRLESFNAEVMNNALD